MIKLLNKKRVLIIILAGVLALTTAVFAFKAKAPTTSADDSIVGSVGGEKITKEELYDYMVKENGETALDSLMADKIISLESKSKNIEVTEAEIQEEVDKAIEQSGGQAAFEQSLQYYGYTMESLKENIRKTINIRKLLEPGITISEEDMKAYFDENKESLNVEEQVKASHILVDTEEKAKEVKEKLAAGGDFATLAKEYSTDTGTSENGGDLGLISKGQMVQEFETAVFSLAVNKISDIVKTEYGYHLIKVTEKKEAKEATYEDSKEKVREVLIEERLSTEYSTWLENKYNEYAIEKSL